MSYARFRLILSAIALCGLYAILHVCLAAHANALSNDRIQGTVINSNITTDTTWTAAGSPYLVSGSMRVISTTILTVEAGTLVQFAQGSDLRIDGRLLAQGNAAQPIHFEGSTAQAGWWYGLSFYGSSSAPQSSSVLDHVVVADGGRGGYSSIELYYATIALTHSTVRNSLNDGLRGLSGGAANISDSSFISNTQFPINFTDGSVNPDLVNLTFNSNGNNAVRIGSGILTGPHRWRALSVPYQIAAITVQTNSVLTLDPGVTVQFETGGDMDVRGQLQARGTVSQPIRFEGTTAQAGWWYGLRFSGTSTTLLAGSALDYVNIADGGRGGYASLELYYATISLTHSSIRNSATDGLRGLSHGVAHIADTSFISNTQFPINFTDGSISPTLANLTVNTNGNNVIRFGTGTFTGARTWVALGVPYQFAAMAVAPESTLTIEPGVEARFEQGGYLTVRGRLIALGSEAQPITLTASTQQPGWWYGLSFSGSTSTVAAIGQLQHVLIEYGGRGGYPLIDLYVGQVTVRESVLRHSATDGVRATYQSLVTIEHSQIVDIAGFGVRSTVDSLDYPILATNNWWGSSSGPTTAGQCNPSGTGSEISGNVFFQPFLTSADQAPTLLSPSATRLLSMSPRRWYAPADNFTRIWVTMTLRDGNGTPLPGRTVRLAGTGANIRDGGVTDAQGQTLAYLTAAQAGEVNLIARLTTSACETAQSAAAQVTFTPPQSDTQYLPESAAPYVNETMKVVPEPIIRGVSTTLSAKIINPNDFPILVDATFAFAQSGIGLAFGPVGEVLGHLIPAHSESLVETMWTPVVSGHYCVRLEFTARQAVFGKEGKLDVKATRRLAPLAGGSSQRNLSVYPGSMGPPNEKDSLDKADKAFKIVSYAPGGPPGVFVVVNPSKGILKGMIGGWWKWAKDTASEISKNLGGDPPRQDYKMISTPHKLSVPLAEPDNENSPARTAAINAVTEAFLEANAQGVAATETLDRYGGAAAANDLQWSSVQAASLIYYKQAYAQALITVSNNIDALIQVAASEGVTSVIVTADEIRAYQTRLRDTGYTAAEISDAKLLGLTDEDIEANRQSVLAADPDIAAGDLVGYLASLSQKFRAVSTAILTPANFGLSVTGGLRANNTPHLAADNDAAAANLVRVYANTASIQLGNPFSQTQTIEMSVRRLALPADWLATVSPVTVTLAPGEQTTVTVSIVPGAAALQGSTARVAVEGHIGTTLLDGVAVDVIMPSYMRFDGQLHAYLPLQLR